MRSTQQPNIAATQKRVCGRETTGTNLFVDRVSLSEYKVTTAQPCEKGIMRSSLPTVQFPLKKKKRLVNGDEFCEIRGMLF